MAVMHRGRNVVDRPLVHRDMIRRSFLLSNHVIIRFVAMTKGRRRNVIHLQLVHKAMIQMAFALNNHIIIRLVVMTLEHRMTVMGTHAPPKIVPMLTSPIFPVAAQVKL